MNWELSKMKAVKTINELYTFNDELVRSAAQAVDFTDDDVLLRSLCSWAAKRCDENEEAVFEKVKTLAENEWGGVEVLRDILEVGLE